MKNHMWSTILKIVSDYDVIARWCWEIESGFVWMTVPDRNEILENRFVETIDSPHTFDELNILEIDRVFTSGEFKQDHDLEGIYKSVKVIAGIKAEIKNDRLTIQSI